MPVIVKICHLIKTPFSHFSKCFKKALNVKHFEMESYILDDA